jgi:hypothetical protein
MSFGKFKSIEEVATRFDLEKSESETKKDV